MPRKYRRLIPKDRRCRDCGHLERRTSSTKCKICGGFMRVNR